MLLKLISFFGIENVLAADIGGTSGGIKLVNPLGEGTTFMTIINNVLNFFIIYIAPPILALMILVGGFQILWAKDDPSKVKSGKDTIKYAVIGFAIILCAKGVALVLIKILS
jgi:hypothetical protein